MTKTETKLIRLAIVAAVIFFLMKRSGARSNSNTTEVTKDTEKPETLTPFQQRLREKYIIWEQDGIRYYTRRDGYYGMYAQAQIIDQTILSKDVPDYITYNGKTYEVILFNERIPGTIKFLVPELFLCYSL